MGANVRHVLERSLQRMDEQLGLWDEAHDRRAVFLDCYARMTRAMGRELDAGGFEDTLWVEQLLDRFADYYFDALDLWEREDPTTPRPWVIAHEASRRRFVTPAQMLLVGVNAHINYDLVLTLVDLLAEQWSQLTRDERSARRRDYDTVNDVIAVTADEVQDDVLERYMPWTDVFDKVMWRTDEWMAVRLLRSWRRDVWKHAGRLLDEELDRREHSIMRRSTQCERRARLILMGRT